MKVSRFFRKAREVFPKSTDEVPHTSFRREKIASFRLLELSCLLTLPSLTCPAKAADVHVVLTHVRNARGHVLLALCAKPDFLKPHCPWQGFAPASPGDVQVTLHGVPPGRYALEAYHDENDNQTLDRNLLGFPTEGLAFSNDAPMHFGPPDFKAAAVDVGASDLSLTMTMRYY